MKNRSFVGLQLLILGALFLLPLAVQAKVTASSENHFIIEHEVTVPLDSQASYLLLGKPSKWWNSEHTWSGDAKNMSLSLKAGGCFCETWGGNSVMHAQVILAQPGSVLRLQGGFGPLQDMAVVAVMTYNLKKTEAGTTVQMIYRVSGNVSHNLGSLTQIVDKVLGE
ncbi:MAG: hypothetical protein ACREO2_03260, partial [Arenimonas sp.]